MSLNPVSLKREMTEMGIPLPDDFDSQTLKYHAQGVLAYYRQGLLDANMKRIEAERTRQAAARAVYRAGLDKLNAAKKAAKAPAKAPASRSSTGLPPPPKDAAARLEAARQRTMSKEEQAARERFLRRHPELTGNPAVSAGLKMVADYNGEKLGY